MVHLEIVANLLSKDVFDNAGRQQIVVEVVHLIQPRFKDLTNESSGWTVETTRISLNNSRCARSASHTCCADARMSRALYYLLICAGRCCTRCRSEERRVGKECRSRW